MKTSKFFIAGLVGFVALFGIGGLWHLGIFADQFAQLAAFKKGLPLTMLFTDVVRGFTLSYLYATYCKGNSPVTEGLKLGLLVAILVGGAQAAFSSNFEAVTNVPMWMLFEGSFILVQFGLAGMFVGLAYGKKQA